MRSALFTLICLLCLFGCSTNNNGVTTVLPAAPSNLTGAAISGTQINLSWTDNATNETGYKIQRKTSVGNFTDVGSTGTDVTTFSDLGLTNNTAYIYRVYAFNAAGNSLQYSNEVTITTTTGGGGNSVTDIDGNIYPTVQICNQVWTAKNLSVSKYRNGDVIPQVTDPIQWINLTTGAWCYYENNSANGVIYGKLYNWYAVNDPRGLAPIGYHVPSDIEWISLETYLGGETVAGGKIKSTTGWNTPNIGATNSSGFTGLPGGGRGGDNNGSFYNVGYDGTWWGSTVCNFSSWAWHFIVNNNSGNIYNTCYIKSLGFSVRCIKD